MKTKLIYITCLIIAGLFQSCNSEVEDLFDTPAQQRLNEELKTCRTLLASSELGWKMDYYPSSIQAYGGYAMTVKFTNTEVTAASEITDDPSMKATSFYSLKSDMGPTLNFDMYNDILHYFADPDNTGGSGVGKGYEGDYEFVIQSHSDNEIMLKGKKTKNLIRMTRLTESSDEYLASIRSIRDDVMSVVGIQGYSGTINGQNVSISMPSDRRINFQIGNNELVKTAFMFTPTGIRLYESVMIGGKEVTTLEWSVQQRTYLSPDKVALTPVPDPVYEKYAQFLGKYTMKYNSGNSARTVNINLSSLAYTPSNKTYVVEGLPFPLQIQYNADKDRMEILTYSTSVYRVAVWEVTGDGNLSWGAGYGLIGQLKAGTTNEYEFVDNGVWETYIARAIILWGADGEYHGFGGDTRFQNIVFIKK